MNIYIFQKTNSHFALKLNPFVESLLDSKTTQENLHFLKILSNWIFVFIKHKSNYLSSPLFFN